MIKLLPLAGVFALLVATPLRAETPRTIDDCEKIQAADAYNQCLASFGPVAKEHNLSPVGAGKVPAVDAKTSALRGDDVTAQTTKAIGKGRAARGRSTRGRRAYRGGSGRKSMSFTVRHSRRR